ncbi:hypothetical protein Ae406Ps2_5574c [Pseudonocardia sp. Ae406_Ps2]|nr:hypothetical protein Ae406Ps2_5574c [Pseudonocardia sp. Ae406_Ps2]
MSVVRSRCWFFSNFAIHHSRFARGMLVWSGQERQKQPSTNTATIAPAKIMSARRRGIPGIALSTR